MHPGLTLTGIYNVLAKLQSNEALNAKEKKIHDEGLVSLLREIHDELDKAVLEAYGWTDLFTVWPLFSASGDGCRPMFEEQVIQRLVVLNHQRSAEEKRGIIRWLRPEYQNKAAKFPQPEQTHLPGTETAPASSSPLAPVPSTTAWPAKLPEQVALIRQLLTADPTSTPEDLSARFGRKNAKRIEQIEGIIETLRGLGQI